jgi:hypothetical protein
MVEYNENISIAENYINRDKEMNLNPQEVCRRAIYKLNYLGKGKDINSFNFFADLISEYWNSCNEYNHLLNFYNSLTQEDLEILGW